MLFFKYRVIFLQYEIINLQFLHGSGACAVNIKKALISPIIKSNSKPSLANKTKYRGPRQKLSDMAQRPEER